MASRRMFSMDVVDTDKFLDMPVTTQALYFHLGMRADDDGFVSAPKKITKIVNCSTDDLRVLVSKGYVIPFESGVIVLTHWKKNNYIQSDRYKKTQYTEEIQQLSLSDGIYSMDTECIQTVSEADTQVRLGKDSIVKDNKKTICPEPLEKAPDPRGLLLPLNDKTTYDVPLSRIETWSAAYPAVDVKQELLKMRSWLESNPQRRKTRRGITRFIDSWLSREQDKGGRYRQQGTTSGQADQTRQGTREKPEYYKFLEGCQPKPDDPFQ